MSFRITKPGFYRQRNGCRCEVKFICDRFAFGFIGARPAVWDLVGTCKLLMLVEYTPSDNDIVSEYHEPPFRISDHGCGVYETRDGMRAIVSSKDASQWPWRGRICDLNADASWKDDGVFGVLGNFALDLVGYIGPLPEPQPEWVATNRWRNRVLNRDAGGTLPDGTISCVVDGAWKFVVPEQLWTCGDREDWRTAEVQR